ncbi:hypothetical protein [Thermosediminibacter litoriperuensis]|uniref:Uncharacterized protein n=1 Tax=Thermosediminibacter litoriperuensis TaxID=291989 RepID=A0A5S5ABF3_9FIRM|nr:hypothetical protein [Thermosediminibacter litoriperuensis]TYP46578.1 hypothetical protein LZ11_02509 [Thermosediminibacter litoriperuensis]
MKKVQILVLVFILTISFIKPTIALAHVPPFYCQAPGNYEGGYWGEGVPDAKKQEIAKEGCAITCCAMVLYPSKAYIYDERVNKQQYSTADPYVVYRANGDDVLANWETIRKAFGWSKYYHIYFSGYDASEKAIELDEYLDAGKHPIGRIPGHFITFVSSEIIGPVSIEKDAKLNQGIGISQDPKVVTEDEIDPLTDEELEKFFGDVPPIKSRFSIQSTMYDWSFKIHDPGTRYGKNIYFADNIKDASLNDLDRITIFE